MQIATKEHTTRVLQNILLMANNIRRDTNEVIASGDHIEIIKHYAELRDINAQIKEARKALEQIEEHLSRDDVPLAMRNAKVKTVTIMGIGRVTVSARWSASMLDKQRGFEWLRNNEAGDLIQETVNAQTLAAFAKELFTSEAKELPDDIFKVGQMTYTSITKV